MIPVTEYAGKSVAVFGLARSGLSTAKALAAGGAHVLAWDDDEERRIKAKDAGLAVENLYEIDWHKPAGFVLTPGVPLTHPKPHPLAAEALAAGCPIFGDVELFANAVTAMGEGRIVAITGTNGKSTTTALIGHVLRECGRPTEVGGNIGVPVLELETVGKDGVYVLEISSYQIDLAPSLAADIAVLLNITPDHLDRHGGMDGYIAVKKRLLTQQRSGQAAVIGVDDAPTSAIFEALRKEPGRRLIPISVGRNAAGGVYVLDGILFDDLGGQAARAMDLRALDHLPGIHNWQNAAAAFATARLLGHDDAAIAEAMATFPGLAHRIETVATIGGVRFVNDSKGTNAEATARALVCFENIYWILGGVAKDGGIEPLEPYFARVRHAYLIGEAAGAFRLTLDGKVPYAMCGTLDVAVTAAAADAKRDGLKDPVVLLSPASASFDQYKDFEDRGDSFRRIVEKLGEAA
jgi:UDP-N-acetylmuramoylalanine--D-glutamate ligase